MERFRFGTKEIIGTVLSVIIIAVLRYAELALTLSGTIDPRVSEWIIPAIPVVTLAAVFFGPVAGLISGIGGNLVKCAIFSTYIDYPEIITLGVYGLVVGLYFGKMHFDHGRFTGTTFLDFNAVHIMTGIFCGMFLLPMLRFFMEDANLYDSVITGAKYCAGDTAFIAIFCSLIIMAVSFVTKRRTAATALEDEELL